MSEWQPIETAPKETTGYFAWPVLIGFAQWNGNNHVGPIVLQPGDVWEFTELDFDMFASPTHWTPLPEPLKGGDALD